MREKTLSTILQEHTTSPEAEIARVRTYFIPQTTFSAGFSWLEELLWLLSEIYEKIDHIEKRIEKIERILEEREEIIVVREIPFEQALEEAKKYIESKKGDYIEPLELADALGIPYELAHKIVLKLVEEGILSWED